VAADDLAQIAHVAPDHVSIEEQQRRKRLGLGRGADRLPDGQLRQEGIDLRLGHLGGVADLVERDEPFHPVAVGLFGAGAAVAGPQGLAQAVEELGLPRLRLSRIGRSAWRTCRCAGWGSAHSVFSLWQGPEMAAFADIRTSPATGKSTAFPGGIPRAKRQRGLTSLSNDASPLTSG
jgi:hypothetical protein